MTDTIEICDLRVFGRHGANPGERDVPQAFDLDLWLDVDLTRARKSDALGDTVDYDALTKAVRRIVQTHSYALLERLGDEIVRSIAGDERVHAVRVRIAKPRLLGGATPAVTVHWERASAAR